MGRRCEKQMMVMILFTCHCLSGINAVGLETSPPAVDGVLTSCGETSLTCRHDNVGDGTTTWTITRVDSSLLCVATIPHAAPMPGNPYVCNAFVFGDITGLTPTPTLLNSTAMVNPLLLRFNGTRMDCLAGGLSSPSVGNVTFCVIDQNSSLTNLRHTLIPNNLTSVVLEWDPLSTCSRDPVSYTFTIDGSPVPAERIEIESSNRYIVSELQPNQRYMAAVSATVSNCMTASANYEFGITARTPRPMVTYEKFCANSSGLTTVKISWMFPSSTPIGVVYPLTDELTFTVVLEDDSGQMVANTTLSDVQTAFFDVSNDKAYSVVVTANHATTGSNSSDPSTFSSQLCTIDTTDTSVDNSVIVRLSTSCTEDSTMFSSTLTYNYGACSCSQSMSDIQAFDSSGTSSFSLNVANFVGSACLRAVTTNQNGLSRSCIGTNGMVVQQLTFNPCPVAPIRSAAGNGVTVMFCPPVTSSDTPPGTVATFVTSDTLFLDGPRQSMCRNGTWDDLTLRIATGASSLSTAEIVIITFVLTSVSFLAVGLISGSLLTNFILRRRRRRSSNSQLQNTPLPVYEEVSQQKSSEQKFEMGANAAYGPVRK